MRQANEMREAAGQERAEVAARVEAARRATWTCPDCGPLKYAVLLDGRGGLRGCPLCGGLASDTQPGLHVLDPQARVAHTQATLDGAQACDCDDCMAAEALEVELARECGDWDEVSRLAPFAVALALEWDRREVGR